MVDVARGFEYAPLRQTVRIVPGQRGAHPAPSPHHRHGCPRAGGPATPTSTSSPPPGRNWSSSGRICASSTCCSRSGVRCSPTPRTGQVVPARAGAGTSSTAVATSPTSDRRTASTRSGHLVLWGLTQPVMPWCSDGPDEAELGGALDTTSATGPIAPTRRAARSSRRTSPTPTANPPCSSPPAAPTPSRCSRQSRRRPAEYYRYLNSGYRLPLVGGTDKMSNGVPVGLYRTYAQLADDEELSYEGWCRAVRSGRSFLSGGPLLSLTVDGREPGDTIELSGPGTVTVGRRGDERVPAALARDRLQRRSGPQSPSPTATTSDALALEPRRRHRQQHLDRRPRLRHSTTTSTNGPGPSSPTRRPCTWLRRTVGDGGPRRTPLHPHARHRRPRVRSPHRSPPR